jgi:hypothetical protein
VSPLPDLLLCYSTIYQYPGTFTGTVPINPHTGTPGTVQVPVGTAFGKGSHSTHQFANRAHLNGISYFKLLMMNNKN